MTGRRDLDIYPLQGQVKEAGSVEGPLHPFSGAALLIAALGADTAQGGTASGTTKNGTVAAAAAGATSLTYTVTGATPAPVVGDYIQIGPAIATFGTAASAVPGTQVVKPTVVSGAGPYTLTVPPLQFKVDTVVNGAAGLVAQNAVGPFTHALGYTNVLPSLTIEKNTGGHQSIQYRGCRVNKFALKCETTNAAANYTADVIAQQHTILTTPTALVDDTSLPWVFAEAALSTPPNGNPNISVEAFELDIENGLKDSWTMNQSHYLQYLTPASFKVSGTFKAVWTSFNDTDWGYFSNAISASLGSLTFSLTHAAGGLETLTLNVPQASLTKYKDDLKTKDIVISNLSWEASYKVSTAQRITATLVNSQSTGY